MQILQHITLSNTKGIFLAQMHTESTVSDVILSDSQSLVINFPLQTKRLEGTGGAPPRHHWVTNQGSISPMGIEQTSIC